MKIYKILVKDYDWNCYTEFIVVGNSINDMLENLYTELFPEKIDIPYYLRSSNFDITCLGEFIPDKSLRLNKILCKQYIFED